MTQRVTLGADRLPAWIQSRGYKRIGLLTNPTGIDGKFVSTIEVCRSLEGVELAALFAVEHGIRGEKQAGVTFEDEIDPKLQLPVYSLYGSRRRPTKEMLEAIDAVVFDIQDVGVRFYTYLTSLVHVMQACAEHDKDVIVLDRPNPLGGKVEGGLLKDGYASTVGVCRMPYRTGMTIGEFARYANDELKIGCDVHVVPMEGWNHSMEFPQTGLHWLPPSPNLPTIDAVRVYAGTCLFEGTNMSEGRGTTRPFELIGAPWLNNEAACDQLNKLNLPGIYFHPYPFTPVFSKHAGELCRGIHLIVTDPESFDAVTSALHVLHVISQHHPEEFAWRERPGGKPFVDLLSGSDLVRTHVHTEEGLVRIIDEYERDVSLWHAIRKRYLLYEE